jgi:hypothetical protein
MDDYIRAMANEQIMTLRMQPALVEAIDIYWHQERLPNRAAAIRELLTWATEQKLGQPAKAKP